MDAVPPVEHPGAIAVIDGAATERMGKLGVVVGNCFGFVGNRMLYAYGRENQLMLLEGAFPAQVDGCWNDSAWPWGRPP